MEPRLWIQATDRGVGEVTIQVAPGARAQALQLLSDCLPAIQDLSDRLVASRTGAPVPGDPALPTEPQT